ncbi:MAG: hypothetical protein AUG03_07360 [Acidobacteria bacterium 13_1_20CM_2_68_14]|nr:MAG: hypothetical protein AUG03_07360 [Acidobacteria bacterium 13_1_20CM_2_68_14]
MIGIGLAVAAALLAVDGPMTAWAASCRNPVLDAVVRLINPIGSGVTLLIACMILFAGCRMLGWSWLRDAARIGALAFAGAGLVEFALKHLVGRPRPDVAGPSLAAMWPTFMRDIDSFPSGHAASVFAVATVFASFCPRLAGPLYTLAAAVSLGRVYLGRHYVSDIVAGAIIGTLVAVYLVRRDAQSRRMPPPAPAC